ncbi:proline-rich protein 33 [Oenanthe melanoleuca]|uniref:proline-rich protein 33 n=1 Tax=Oenanthe melanoleuca TaxID=2939378 RepID=UPI0024C15125|nr:proline-rich protein 33 [Oenanthe melanoleuca]
METNYTSEMTMLITVSSSTQPVSNQHPLSPPPTLPKPGKDNLRLQRLLKRAARKNAMLASEQGKAFRSSLSPVSEASPDQERAESPGPAAAPPEPRAERPGPAAAPPEPRAERPAALPAQLSARPAQPRAPSPLRKGKPFTLKVTEQRRIAEHVRLTACSAMPLLHKPGAPETPQQPEGSHLPSPSDPSVPAFPQPPPSNAASKERAPEVTCVTKVNTYFHSVKPPRAKTPTPNPTQGTVSHEDTRPTSPAPQTSSSEPSPEQTPTSPKDSKVTPPSPKPALLPAAETKPPDQAPRPVPTEKPSTSDAHTNKPTTHGSDTEIPGSKTPPELPKQDRDTLNPSTSSAPWRQARPATATPAQADGTGSTSTDSKAKHIPEQMTPSSPNSSCPPKAEPAPPSVEAPRPPGASAWHRLKKHLMVQPEATNFPESKPEKLGQEEGNKEDAAQAVIKQDCTLVKSKATRMWDAILYQVALTKERKQRAEEKKPQKEESIFLPRRLPILLHKPRFDARKLKELAAKPMTKISTVFEVSRFRPRGAEEHSKSFNRTASGWSVN